jgi:hypothetical protein
MKILCFFFFFVNVNMLSRKRWLLNMQAQKCNNNIFLFHCLENCTIYGESIVPDMKRSFRLIWNLTIATFSFPVNIQHVTLGVRTEMHITLLYVK